jgi:hypothetical protein
MTEPTMGEMSLLPAPSSPTSRIEGTMRSRWARGFADHARPRPFDGPGTDETAHHWVRGHRCPERGVGQAAARVT